MQTRTLNLIKGLLRLTVPWTIICIVVTAVFVGHKCTMSYKHFKECRAALLDKQWGIEVPLPEELASIKEWTSADSYKLDIYSASFVFRTGGDWATGRTDGWTSEERECGKTCFRCASEAMAVLDADTFFARGATSKKALAGVLTLAGAAGGVVGSLCPWAFVLVIWLVYRLIRWTVQGFVHNGRV